MKYVVMQCTKGYAVLMDEESKFYFAANLNYEVGQTVTNPVILSNKYKDGKPVMTIIKTIAAAAACIGVISIPCYSYYNKNLKPCSTVTFASDTAISMTLNSSGKVLSIESDNEYGSKIIEKVNIKGKDNVEAANEILQAEISEGYISAGDTVEIYVEAKSDEKVEDIKSKLETELPKHDIKVNIHDEKKPPKREDKADKLPHEKPTAEITTAATKVEKPVHTVKTKPVEKPVPPVKKEEPVETPTTPVVVPPADTPPVDTPPVDVPPVVVHPTDTPPPPLENETPHFEKNDNKEIRPPHENGKENNKEKNEFGGVHTELTTKGGILPHEKK